MHSDVLVVGGGPVGLINALSLARQGFSVTVVEREADVFRHPRAMTYHWSVMYGLEDLGLLDDMKRVGFMAYESNFHVWATGENVTFSMGVLDGRVAHPYVITLGQDRFAEIVIDHLKQYSNAQIRWNTEVNAVTQTEDQVSVEITVDGQHQTLTADWLIAADGGQSRVRSELGLDFGGLTWPHKFIATNVRYDFGALGLHVTNYLIDPKIGAVVARVTRDGLWRVTWSEDADLPESELDARVAAQFAALLPADAEWELVSKAMYRMHQRAADNLRVGRVLLVGDAAHITNPTSGFGLVGGLHDSYILSDALGAVLRKEASPDVLDKYSEDRLTAFWTVSSPTSVESKRLVFHSDDADRLEVDLKMFRRVAADPALLLGYWLRGRAIETPSVVTGRFLSSGRNDPAPTPQSAS
jgi:3-(3-hydroxy-phenyl)propionate hydroxylase